MSRFSMFVVSLAILSVGCAPSFDDAVNRCAAVGTADSTDCVKRMRRLLADEKRYDKSFCYTVIDRVVCKKDPLHPFDAASALKISETDYTGGR